MHPLLHKYAGFLLAHSPDEERQLGESRFVQHYAAVASTLAQHHPEDLAAIDRISANLIKAVRLAAAAGAHTVVSDLVFNLCVDTRYFTDKNLDHVSISVLEQAIISERQIGNRNRESVFVGHLGSAHARLGANTQAVAHFEHAISLARELGNDYDLASHLQNLGTTLLSEARNLPRAEHVLHEALSVAERSANVEALINTLNDLGLLHRETGNLSEARRLYSAALRASRLASRRQSEGNSQSNLGLVISKMGDDKEAEQMISEALAIAVEIGDKRGEGNRTGHLGNLLFARAQALPSGEERLSLVMRGRQYVENALRIAEETGDTEKAATWLMNLGLSSRLAGDDTRGIEEIGRALALAKSGGFARLEALAHYNLGFAMSEQGRMRRALRHLEAASALLRNMGSPMAAHAEAELRRLQGKE